MVELECRDEMDNQATQVKWVDRVKQDVMVHLVILVKRACLDGHLLDDLD
jgi:hypothetical protein